MHGECPRVWKGRQYWLQPIAPRDKGSHPLCEGHDGLFRMKINKGANLEHQQLLLARRCLGHQNQEGVGRRWRLKVRKDFSITREVKEK